MTQVPVVRAREVLAALRRAGFELIHQTGSHARLRKVANPTLNATVPIHGGDVPKNTLRRILEQAQLSVDEFSKLL